MTDKNTIDMKKNLTNLLHFMVFLVLLINCAKNPNTTSKAINTTVEVYQPKEVADNALLDTKSPKSSNDSKAVVKPKEVVTSKEVAFINRFKKSVIQEGKLYKIPPSIKLAQAALETGWGEGKIAKEANNLYGVKYKGDFTDRDFDFVKGSYEKETREFVGSTKVKVKAKFARYESAWNSIRHHSEWLKSRIDGKFNKAYASLSKAKDYKAWARGLQKAGYSTDPDYANKLIQIIETFDLHTLDNILKKN